MKIISAVFDTQAQGEQAVEALENAGVASISIASADPNAGKSSGGTLVTATVNDEQADIAEAILGTSDVAARPAGQDRDAWEMTKSEEVLPGDRISDDPSDLPPLPR